MYQDERVAMCYDAGRLTAVRYGTFEYDDSPPMLAAVILDFEAGSWVLAVNGDDDTVRIESAEAFSLEEDMCVADAPAESPWTRALGAGVRWVWIMVNQQGYEDGLQFCFSRDGSEVCRIQLMAAASSWDVGVIVI